MIVLRRQLYSLVEEERNYSILSDLWKKGKRKLVNRLEKIEKSNLKKNEDIIEELNELKEKQRIDKKLTDNIINEAKNSGIDIYGDNRPYFALDPFATKKGGKNGLITDDVDRIKRINNFFKEIGETDQDDEVLESFYKNKGNIINIKGDLNKNNIMSSHELGHWKK